VVSFFEILDLILEEIVSNSIGSYSQCLFLLVCLSFFSLYVQKRKEDDDDDIRISRNRMSIFVD